MLGPRIFKFNPVPLMVRRYRGHCIEKDRDGQRERQSEAYKGTERCEWSGVRA